MGTAAPAVEGPDLTGTQVTLAAFKGHPVVLNFWASWCVPCRDEFPVIKAGLDKHRADGLAAIGVLFKDEPDLAKAFITDFGLTVLLVICVGQVGYMLVPGYGPYVALADTFKHPLPDGFWYRLVLDTVTSGSAQKDLFPSLHTGGTMTIAIFCFRHRRHAPFRYTWPITAFFALNTMGATIYLRWHWAIDVIAGLRGWSRVPILVVSARDAEGEKVRALDAGADDYVTKPFEMNELLARLRAAVRRGSAASAHDGPHVVETGGFSIDLASAVVSREGQQVRLTPTEYHLLEVLARNLGRLVPQQQLLTEVWGPGYGKETHYLRVYVGQLRRKLEEDPASPRHIITEPGLGYRLDA